MQLTRLTVDAFDCDGELLNADAIDKAMREGVDLCGASVRQCAHEQFNPHGITCVLILGESHMVVSTWPENRFASIDAALCNPELDIALLIEPVLALLLPGRFDRKQTGTWIGVEHDARELIT